MALIILIHRQYLELFIKKNPSQHDRVNTQVSAKWIRVYGASAIWTTDYQKLLSAFRLNVSLDILSSISSHLEHDV